MPTPYDRPEIIVDTWGFQLRDPVTRTLVGDPPPPHIDRLVSAARLNDGPHLLEAEHCVVDTWGFTLYDPATRTRVGFPPLWINRMLAAAP